MEQVKRKDETLYLGSDWARGYEIKGGFDLKDATIVCKFRDKNDNLLFEAECTIQENCIFVSVPSALSLTMPRTIRQGRYDIFIVGATFTHKIIMGSVTFVPDVSMH